MSISNPKLLDPRCLSCGHLWSKHFVNDSDRRCSLTLEPGREKYCGCSSFRVGCETCNHPMKDHGIMALGMCQNRSLYDDTRCTCERYER